jgi:hypothetical protein
MPRFVIFTPYQIYLGDKNQEKWFGRVEERTSTYSVLLGKP